MIYTFKDDKDLQKKLKNIHEEVFVSMDEKKIYTGSDRLNQLEQIWRKIYEN